MNKYFNIINTLCTDKKTTVPDIFFPEIDKIDPKYQIADDGDDKVIFNKEYLKNLPSLFYFLDGFVKENVGYYLDYVYDYLDTNDLISDKNICYITMNRSNVIKMSLNFYNSLSKSEIEIYPNIDESKFAKLFDENCYWITHVGHDIHATSFVLYTKNNQINFMAFNSGNGINVHLQHNDLYSPYIGFVLCDDKTDKTKYNEAYLYYLQILYFNFFYEIMYEYTHSLRDSVTISILINIQKIYTKIVKPQQNDDFSKEFDITIDHIDSHDIINDFNKKTNKEKFEYDYTKLSKISGISISIEMKSNYYELLHKYFIKSSNQLIFNNDLNIFDVKNINNLNTNPSYKSIPENIKNKNNLHCYSNKLYIYPQQSGSCTWFSIYWPLLFYHVIYTEDFTKYLETFNKIFNTAYKYIHTVFKKQNFINEYISEKSYYNFMVNICHKLININILDKSYLNSIDDIIYEIPFALPSHNTKTVILSSINLNKKKTLDDFINVDYNNIEKLRTFMKQYEMSHVLNYVYEMFHDSIDTQVIMLWELFINSKNIYKNVPLNVKTINDFINEKYIANNSFNKDDVKKLKLNITLLIDEYNDILNISNNILNISNDKSPIYVVKYYFLFIYLYNFYKENDIASLPDKNDKLIINFATYMHKFNLFTSIMEILKKYERNLYDAMFYSNRAWAEQHCTMLHKNTLDTIISHIFTHKCEKEIGYINMYHNFGNFNKMIHLFNIYDTPNIFQLKNTSIDANPKNKNLNRIGNSTRYIYEFPVKDAHQLDIDTYNLDILHKYNIYLLNHPEFMYDLINQPIYNKDYHTQLEITCYYIQINIFLIFQHENIRKTLLKYMLHKYFHNSNYNVLYCIQLLIFKYGKMDDAQNILQIKHYDINIFKNINSILRDHDNVKDFCDYVMSNEHVLCEDLYLSKLINKWFDSAQINDNYVIINNNKFYTIKLNESHILVKTFCNNIHHYILNSEQNDLIYIITSEFIIKLNIIIKKSSYYIDKIEYNNNIVIKYKDITAPFKYIIPRNFIYLIYKSNNIYNITYFINSKLEPNELNLFSSINISKSIITLSINPNNLFFPNKLSYDDFIHFENLLLNGGVNNFNLFYIKSNDTYGAYVNNKIYNIIKNDIAEIYNLPNMYNNTTELLFLNNNNTYPIISLHKENNDIIKQFKINYSTKIESLTNLLFKISKCNINPNKTERNIINEKLIKIIKISNKLIYEMTYNLNNDSVRLSHLFDAKYDVMYNYLLYLKISNICKDLLKTPNINLCSKIKIYNEQLKIKKHSYNYNFEKIFELFFGNEISNEQYDRYIQIINSYKKYANEPEYVKKQNISNTINIYNYNDDIIEQTGGIIDKKYPLHHFMMGKGKSSVITPLLSLYFTLIEKKTVYIIVPEHLKSQTIDTIYTYTIIFNLNLSIDDNNNTTFNKNNIIITTDTQIKNMFLNGNFTDENDNKNIIFLIDEFDSILNPLKSNYNVVVDDKINTPNIIADINMLIKEINVLIKKNNINYDFTNVIKQDQYENINNFDLLLQDITTIINQIKMLQLKENINWGIHPTKCFAIPYMTKDKPMLKSKFSSYILTIFLTYYYYINLNNYELTYNLYYYVIDNNLLEEIFNIQNGSDITFDAMKMQLDDLSLKTHFFDIVFSNILDNVQLTIDQYNTSFVDIINITNIFKIGYSGTINIDLPELNITFMDPVSDYDEELNVKYAILKSNIINTDNDELFYNNNIELLNKYFNDVHIIKYDALIDACGLFKNYDNYDIAYKLNEILNRPIIFLDNDDNKLIINKKQIMMYDENILYINPFIYYSQTHIIGIDIKQDYYPKLNGLCIIDSTSIYTTVAQAIFRLRKLNMGHTINFNLIKMNNMHTTYELYDYLKLNDDTSKQNKYKSLIFQTLKSSIRKKNRLVPFNENYKEKVKYYFIKTTELNILENIIDISNLSNHEQYLYDLIKNDLYHLVHSINSLNTNTVEKLELEQDLENKTNLMNELSTEYKDYSSMTETYSYNTTPFYLNESIYFINDFFDKIIYKINDIYATINIFSLKTVNKCVTTITFNKKTMVNYIFVLYKDKLILTNTTIYQYIYNKYPVLNLNLNLINNDYCKLKQSDINFIKNKYDQSSFLQIINNKNKNEELIESLSEDEKYIFLILLKSFDYKLLNNTQHYYYDLIHDLGNVSINIKSLHFSAHLHSSNVKQIYDELDQKFKLKCYEYKYNDTAKVHEKKDAKLKIH